MTGPRKGPRSNPRRVTDRIVDPPRLGRGGDPSHASVGVVIPVTSRSGWWFGLVLSGWWMAPPGTPGGAHGPERDHSDASAITGAPDVGDAGVALDLRNEARGAVFLRQGVLPPTGRSSGARESWSRISNAPVPRTGGCGLSGPHSAPPRREAILASRRGGAEWVPHTVMTPSTSGTELRSSFSMPSVSVAVDIGQPPQAPIMLR